MIEHVIFKIGNFQKEMKEDMLLEKTFQDKNQRKEQRHNSKTLTIYQRNSIHSTCYILQWRSLLFIAMKFNQARSLKR